MPGSRLLGPRVAIVTGVCVLIIRMTQSRGRLHNKNSKWFVDFIIFWAWELKFLQAQKNLKNCVWFILYFDTEVCLDLRQSNTDRIRIESNTLLYHYFGKRNHNDRKRKKHAKPLGKWIYWMNEWENELYWQSQDGKNLQEVHCHPWLDKAMARGSCMFTDAATWTMRVPTVQAPGGGGWLYVNRRMWK